MFRKICRLRAAGFYRGARPHPSAGRDGENESCKKISCANETENEYEASKTIKEKQKAEKAQTKSRPAISRTAYVFPTGYLI
ncbi:MAG: hypothetical protein IJC78_04175 [Clostridia bacterium]|nr:hypothetical protein [Clostridia bacterium]